MNKKTEKTDWGIVYRYENDICRFALYFYDDDKSVIYLSNVNVVPDARNRGIGNIILEFAENEAKRLKSSAICLKVLRLSWMHKWYQKHGYRDYCNDEDDRYVWMKHTLK